jgi:hypothetical protein
MGNTIRNERGNCVEEGFTLHTYQSEYVAQVKLEPKDHTSKWTVLWFDGQGKQGLYDDTDKPILPVARLLSASMEVIGADLVGQGELKGALGEHEENRRVKDDRNFAGYTYGYNSPLFVQRVHDIMTVASVAHSQRQSGERIALVGVNGAGPWVAAAMVLIGDAADAVAIDTEGFRFANLTDYADPQFVPGAVKYGDLPGLLNLLGKRPVWLGGESAEFAEKLAATLGNQDVGGVTAPKEKAEDHSSALVDWMLSGPPAAIAK